MGHPSKKVVKLLPPLCGHKGSLNTYGDIYFRVEHSRDKLLVNNN